MPTACAYATTHTPSRSKTWVLLQAEYVVLSEDQLRERQQELTETTQAVLGLDAGSAAHVLRFCDW